MAFQTNIEFVRTGTVTMAVTLTLDRTIGTNVTKVTTANIGFDACASYAALRAHRYTNVLAKLVHPGSFGLVSISAFALETFLLIEALFALIFTSVMSIYTFVLRRTAYIVPREF